MVFTKEKKFSAYKKLLERFIKGEYVSKATENANLSRQTVRNFCNMLSKKGYIFLTSGEQGKTFVNFTNKGNELLREYFGESLLM